jgi:cyclohexanecarboxylate-CoA ligase/acyl-CoA synthetase
LTRTEIPRTPLAADRYDEATIARFKRHGWWQDRHLVDYLDHWADTAPDRRFITDGTNDLAYREFRQQAMNLSLSLRRLGVGVGDRVVVQLPNWSEFAVAYLGLTRIGAVLVPIMPIYRDREVEYILKHSRAVAAITAGQFRGFDHANMFHRLRTSCPELLQVVVARGETALGDHRLEDLIEPDQNCALTGLDPPSAELSDHPHSIVYTSGTESTPKGCLHSWNTMGFSARGLANDILRLTSEDVVFMPSPITHSTGLVVGVVAPIIAGCAVHLLDEWEPEIGLQRMSTFRCTVTATATPFVRMALDALGAWPHDLRTMRAWICAGAPVPANVASEVAAAIPGCSLLPLWGCSEVLAGTCCTLDDPLEAVTDSDGGPALPGVEVKLMDARGSEAEDQSDGELLYRGPGAMLGYWDEPERTRAAIDADGWYRSGDLAAKRPDGYIRITGRIKDLIIRGGTNISAREIEEELETHPLVRSAAVVGCPDERLGERACAFIVPEQRPPTLAEIREYLHNERKLAIQKVPERLQIIDALPMTPTGKVRKSSLRDSLVRHATEEAAD